MTASSTRLSTSLAAIAAAFTLALGCIAGQARATDPQPDADFLLVGSYHMNNPGRDVHNTRADDVLAPKRQREIAEVARLIGRYRPTKIMVETDLESQPELEEAFAASCNGDRPLKGDEREQLGFRIACAQKLDGVIAVNWNDLGPIRDEDSIDYLKAIERHGQQAQHAEADRIGQEMNAVSQRTLDEGTVGDMLLWLNSPEWLRANARAYFRIGLYGSADDAVGANWDMLWYGRNLRIFNNIVRRTEPGDRVLVIYGAGHGNLLRQFAVDSGKYRVHDAQAWLQDRTPADASK